ncbi:MAG: response regulator transcription factor [Gammaproteobacteria bacterium]
MRLLIVEDDTATARMYRLALTADGHAVDVAATGEEGRLLGATTEHDGIILDLGLRDRHGLKVLAEWRRAGISTPVLVCTGQDSVDDVVLGLDSGADEYVVKPVATAELRARVRALVRRGRAGAPSQEQLIAGNVCLNRLSRQVLVSGKLVGLTPRELAVLEYLLLRPQEVVSRTELLEKVWDLTFDPGSNVVDVLIGRARRKLRTAGATLSIASVRGVGFTARSGASVC